MKNPIVAIVILNWNNWWDTLDCLKSLNKQKYSNHSIWIIDNGSKNDSRRKITAWLGRNRHKAIIMNEKDIKNRRNLSRLTGKRDRKLGKYLMIYLDENTGYAGGNNRALELARDCEYDYAWLLNNDTRVSDDALQELVQSAEQDERIGMEVSYLVGEIGDNKIEDKSFYFQDRQQEVKSLTGGCILVRIKCIKEIGLIDENYFCYGEELDWSLSARFKGWKLIRNYRSVVFHKWGSSTKSKRIEKYFMGKKVVRISWPGFRIPGYYEARNGIYFMKKNHNSLWIPYSLIRNIHLIIQICLYDDHKWERIKIIMKGAWDGIWGRMGRANISL